MTCPCTPLAALDRALAQIADEQAQQGAGRPLLSLAATRGLAESLGVSLRDVERRALACGLIPARYERNLGTVGVEGQCRLLEATVAVAGCGGLGGWVAEGLARMGIGHLILIDPDRFEESNLNRQLGCVERTVGELKAPCVAERVREVNRAVTVTPVVARVTAENAAELLAGAEVIVDALDTLPARLTLEGAARQLGVPLVHGAIAGFTGQVMTVLPGDPGLSALYGAEIPERGVETTQGNPAATPMMVAAWQVHEVVKALVGMGELIRHRLLVVDAEWGEVTGVGFAEEGQGGVR